MGLAERRERETMMVWYSGHLLSLFLFLACHYSFVADAHIANFDETWTRRAEEARAEAFAAYHPNPQDVVDHVNHRVNRSFMEMESNTTRRLLHRKYTGPCLATNPIDRCWRCDPNWHKRRKRLAKCVLGFGRKTVGGKKGRYYIVTDPSDNDLVNPKPGTIRHAVTRKEPLWITFARDMVIKLNEELIVASYKTIDGRGHQVHIAYGGQITLQFVKHVIIHGLHIHDMKSGSGGMIRDSIDHFGERLVSDGDGISIFGSSNVWIDHVSMSNCMDGLIDAVATSTAITISNSHFTHHDEVMLFGATDNNVDDRIMQITLAFNHFGRGLKQRMPRGRYGFFHVVNNDYTHWEMYAIGGNQNPTIISQGNRYIAPPVTDPEHNATEVTKREFTSEDVWKNWVWKSEGDLLQNGAFFVESGPKKLNLPYSSQDMIKAKPGEYVTRLTRFAGTLTCRKNKPC